MRKIDKSPTVPADLLAKQAEIEVKLLEKKANFSWQTSHYSDPIKEELKKNYNNKCGFCEQKLTDRASRTNTFSVEHFRPKNGGYWWLGNEWTNLFPLCTTCNGKKAVNFEVLNQKQKRENLDNPPIDAGTNILDRSKCLANHPNLLAEKPLFLHPEIDEPEDFLEVNQHGKVLAKTGLSADDQKRADKMLEILNLPLHEDARKDFIDKTYHKDLQTQLQNFISYASKPYSDNELRLCFFAFFTKMLECSLHESAYSLLGVCMLQNFDIYFIKNADITGGEVICEQILEDAFKLFIAENMV
jgi:uncharacterized protein (TIGR02646 family)